MLRINKKIEYGVIALLHLAGSESKVASVREISEQCHISETLLSKIMQKLKSSGFVSSVHGNQGGYQLAKPLSTINLLDLTKTLQGPVQVAECLEPGHTECPVQSTCTIVTPMTMLNQRIIWLFQTTSLETLASSRKVAL